MRALTATIVEHENPGRVEIHDMMLPEKPTPDQPFQPMRVPIQNDESGKIPARDYDVSWIQCPPTVPLTLWTKLTCVGLQGSECRRYGGI